jgi:transcriptional regulator with XRE-family HTH domain
MSRLPVSLPVTVSRGLSLLGRDLREARLRRRLRASVLAERARISLPTLAKVEKGDPAVSLGIYATVLWVLGFGDRMATLAAPSRDDLGLELEAGRLPKRVRSPRRGDPELPV